MTERSKIPHYYNCVCVHVHFVFAPARNGGIESIIS